MRRKPRVALFSTGDELVMPGESLKPGAIYNSNRFTLRALFQAAGCEVGDLGIVPDRLDALVTWQRAVAKAKRKVRAGVEAMRPEPEPECLARAEVVQRLLVPIAERGQQMSLFKGGV